MEQQSLTKNEVTTACVAETEWTADTTETYELPTLVYRDKPLVLITGANGKLGSEVSKLYPDALRPSHQELPVEDRKKVFEYIRNTLPEIIIHLAAKVSPVKCEENKEQSWKVTVEGTLNLIEACRKYNPKVYFVLMSTPCVFDGNDATPKDEYHYYDASNYYGWCKAMQEMVVRASGLKWLIIRGNFIPYKKYPYEKAFVDRKSNYLFAHQLARGIKEVIDANMTGIVHVLGNKIISMYELAKRTPDSKNVKKTTLEEYYKENPNSCKLTKNMIMKSTRFKEYDIDES